MAQQDSLHLDLAKLTMTLRSLHMESLCVILLLHAAAHRSLCAPQRNISTQGDVRHHHKPRCMTEEELRKRGDNILHGLGMNVQNAQKSNITCAQVVEEIRKNPQGNNEDSRRSLAPWMYMVKRDNARVPAEISEARCICNGCIINRMEDHSYNSKTVVTRMMVMKKKQCANDPKKYTVEKEFIEVAVGCICVRPEYSG